jgi:hypothetical protein
MCEPFDEVWRKTQPILSGQGPEMSAIDQQCNRLHDTPKKIKAPTGNAGASLYMLAYERNG